MVRLRAVAVLASSLAWSAAVWAQPPRNNVVLIIADDVGTNMLRAYYQQPLTPAQLAQTPQTPTLDALASAGIMFRNAWSSPICGPTRATIQTGRYGHRTGVYLPNGKLEPRELTIPEVIARDPNAHYATAMIGKWGLGGPGTVSDHPVRSGYDLFLGDSNCCLDGSFFDWPKYFARFDQQPGCSNDFSWHENPLCIESGEDTSEPLPDYATTENVDDALKWIGDRADGHRWFLTVSFNAAHSPYDGAPAHLDYQEGDPPDCMDPLVAHGSETEKACYRNMIEAMDREIFRLIDEAHKALVEDDWNRTVWIFVGDNGTPPNVSELSATRSKGSLYQGGVNVPLIAWGPGVLHRPAPSDALVNTSDLFMTVLDLTGIGTAAFPTELQGPQESWNHDSYSIAPILQGTVDEVRHFAYAELQGTQSEKTIRNRAGYKLIVRTDFERVRYEFYSLNSPAGEEQNLVDDDGNLSPANAALEPVLEDLKQRIGPVAEPWCPPPHTGCQVNQLAPLPPPPNLPAANLDRDADGVAEDGFPGGLQPCEVGEILGCDDNCPWTPNPLQEDIDSDGIGDRCDGACTNQIDDDGDGATDYPADAGCGGATWNVEDPGCNNGLDDDRDGLVDSDGAGVASPDPSCDQASDTFEVWACQDGQDNDGDGLKDFDGGQSIYGACSGGVCPPGVSDVGQDGIADADPQCGSASHYTESPACGLGMELVLLAPLLARLQRLRRTALNASPTR